MTEYSKNPSPKFWNNLYKSGHTGWDIGDIATPLKEYFTQVARKDLSILIPGAGNGHEAGHLYQEGFKNISILDFATEAVQNFRIKFPNFPENQIFNADFFEHQGQYDIIIELTFLSSLHPELRIKYVKKMNELLKPGGKLIGLLFNHQFNSKLPPFGGTKEEYLQLFSKYFNINKMELAYN